YIAYVDANHGSCFAENCLGQVAFTTTEFKNGFVPDERLQTSAQNLVPESRVGNMPGVRRRVIEIKICSRSHCWFPLRAWLKTSAIRNAYCATALRASKVSGAVSARACASNGLLGFSVTTR